MQDVHARRVRKPDNHRPVCRGHIHEGGGGGAGGLGCGISLCTARWVSARGMGEKRLVCYDAEGFRSECGVPPSSRFHPAQQEALRLQMGERRGGGKHRQRSTNSQEGAPLRASDSQPACCAISCGPGPATSQHQLHRCISGTSNKRLATQRLRRPYIAQQ